MQLLRAFRFVTRLKLRAPLRAPPTAQRSRSSSYSNTPQATCTSALFLLYFCFFGDPFARFRVFRVPLTLLTVRARSMPLATPGRDVCPSRRCAGHGRCPSEPPRWIPRLCLGCPRHQVQVRRCARSVMLALASGHRILLLGCSIASPVLLSRPPSCLSPLSKLAHIPIFIHSPPSIQPGAQWGDEGKGT